MNTPVCDFVKAYADANKLRLHMPGHKGKGALGIERLDITEIDGADVLYHANGIIKESEQNASKLFLTAKTVYSAEGSSLCIRAMVYLAAVCGNKKNPYILAVRNAHKTFISAAAVLGVDVGWIYPKKTFGLAGCRVTAEDIENAIASSENKPSAVWITSPDYLGNIAPISEISAVCRKYGVLLLVDNAHGAYLKFLPENRHPIALGADVCCDSAHKTLSCLTGGAYLHISRSAPESILNTAESAMSLFASTSPSYLILQSLDALNGYLSGDFPAKLRIVCENIKQLKADLQKIGFTLLGDEPLKLTVSAKPYGYTGAQIADFLSDNGIVCEFYDNDYVVLMFTECIQSGDFEKIITVFKSIEKRQALPQYKLPQIRPLLKITPKKAVLCESEELPVKECMGRFLATPSVSCPPAIPIAVCGEVIDRDVIEIFNYYGIEKCRVVKE